MSLTGHNTNIAPHRRGCRLPFERSDIGDGYTTVSPVTTYTMSPEELQSIIGKRGKKVSPIANVANETYRKACPDLCQRWREWQFDLAKKLWTQGASICEMVEKFAGSVPRVSTRMGGYTGGCIHHAGMSFRGHRRAIGAS